MNNGKKTYLQSNEKLHSDKLWMQVYKHFELIQKNFAKQFDYKNLQHRNEAIIIDQHLHFFLLILSKMAHWVNDLSSLP